MAPEETRLDVWFPGSRYVRVRVRVGLRLQLDGGQNHNPCHCNILQDYGYGT